MATVLAGFAELFRIAAISFSDFFPQGQGEIFDCIRIFMGVLRLNLKPVTGNWRREKRAYFLIFMKVMKSKVDAAI